MDKSASHRIVRETFENSFDKERFVYFVKNLLNLRNDQLENKHPYSGKYIPDAYKNHFSTLKRIAKYSDGESKIDILIVHLKKETSIERARSMQRNFIAWYLNGSRGSELKDAALVAFVSPDNNDWRFSLVKMDYKFEEGKNGKMKVKEEFTPARRWSFLVGINESSHTAQRQFLPILENDEDNPTLRQLEEAFSVEKVTKEFFGEYKKLFEELVKELGNNHTFKNEAVKYNINTENFAKKLLGQIVFLYFLQKKRWLGAAKDKALKQGDENFLRNLFEKKYIKYSNFFNDILEHLFYDALNKKSEKAGTFYRDYFKCQIPFLNGGLFDPEYEWDKSKIYLDDKIFARILEVFDRYNFTVDESSPIDQEVAIDPEMLGKVFENLLSENLRKGRGTYYTPREIVHYMCQESLINYLVTESKIKEEIIRKLITQQDIVSDEELSNLSSEDELEQAADKNIFLDKTQAKKLNWLLRTIKVVDPACGSGAFLVGMLQEITRACLFLDKWYLRGNKNEYQLKKETIQNSIYGVDIDPGAVEIAKLRLWLSLVVDYELEEIEPLPNLDYKIMQGNSLLEEFAGINISENKQTKLHNNLQELENEIIKVDKERKINQSEFIENLNQNQKQEKKLLEISKILSDKDKKLKLQQKKLLKELEDFREDQKQKKLIDKLHKKQKELFSAFDVEIKNKLRDEIENIIVSIFKLKVENNKSEYFVRMREVEYRANNLPNIQERNNYIKNEKERLKKYFDFDFDIIESQLRKYFHNKEARPFFLWHLYFADVFENGGFDVVIANPPYVDYRKISNDTKNGLVKFYSYQKTKTASLYIYFIELSISLLKDGGVSCYINPYQYLVANSGKGIREFLIKNVEILRIIDVSNIKVFLEASTYTCINFFRKKIINKKHKIEIVKCKTLNNISNQGFNICQSDVKKDDNYLINISPLSDVLKKIENQKNVLKDFCKIFCGTSSSGFSKQIIDSNKYNKVKEKNEYCIIKQSSDIKKYYFNKKCKYINKNIYPKHILKFFNKEKIFFARMTKNIRCSFVKEKYCAGKVNVLVDFKLSSKYLIALLNSKLINFWYLTKYESNHLSGGYLGFNIPSIEKIPIPKISTERQKPFIKLVDQILEKKKDNPETDTGELERKIDEMVYRLYGLGEEEIGIVEKSS